MKSPLHARRLFVSDKILYKLTATKINSGIKCTLKYITYVFIENCCISKAVYFKLNKIVP